MSRNRAGRRALTALAPVAAALALVAVPLTARDAVTATTPEQEPDGQQLYGQYCAVCHQATGQGLAAVFPPLAGSEWVTGPKGRVVRAVLHGVTGPITVKGTNFNSLMPGWGAALNDAQVAAVATYVRASWDNKASAVTTAEVAAVRTATADRKTPWTAAELTAVAE